MVRSGGLRDPGRRVRQLQRNGLRSAAVRNVDPAKEARLKWFREAKYGVQDYDQYLRGKAEPQVRELLTGYGPVALIWFDTPRMMTGDRAQRFANIVRTLQPSTLIDGRLGTEGDYRRTGDNVIPPQVSSDAWEVPATINHTWGYRTDDTDGKAPVEMKRDNGRTNLDLKRPILDPMATFVVVEFSGDKVIR